MKDYELMLEKATTNILAQYPDVKNALPGILWPFEVLRKDLPFVGDDARRPEVRQSAMRNVDP